MNDASMIEVDHVVRRPHWDGSHSLIVTHATDTEFHGSWVLIVGGSIFAGPVSPHPWPQDGQWVSTVIRKAVAA